MNKMTAKEYKTLNDFFRSISHLEYCILRNHEDFSDMRFLNQHPDIDILCDNQSDIVLSSGMAPKHRNDKVHYYTIISGVKVSVDLRMIGDGYYCKSWEETMLENRIRSGEFFILDPLNYFFSLLYHVIIQKDEIAKEYQVKLCNLAEKCGIEFDVDNGVQMLDAFVRKNKYEYSYPCRVTTKANFEKIDSTLIERNTVALGKRKLYQLYRRCKWRR